jgi:hypothetical protein
MVLKWKKTDSISSTVKQNQNTLLQAAPENSFDGTITKYVHDKEIE